MTNEETEALSSDATGVRVPVTESSEEEVFVQEGSLGEKKKTVEKYLDQDVSVCNGTSRVETHESQDDCDDKNSVEKRDLPQVTEKLGEDIERS